MAIERPDIEQLQVIASQLHMSISPTEAEEYLALMQANFDAYDLIDSLPDAVPEVRYPRSAGYRPEGAENPHNGWYYKTEVKGAATGKLAGRTVALKDNIALAGVPMMNGTSTLEGFVPTFDATVVTRLLDAGAPFLARRPVSTSACPAVVIPPILLQYTILIVTAMPLVGLLPAVQCWLRRGMSIWLSVAIRAGQSASHPHFAAPMA